MHIRTMHSIKKVLLVSAVLVAACSSNNNGPKPGSPALDGGPEGAAPQCPTVSGAGTTHATVSGDETWTASASPHVIPNDLSISSTITLEDCAVVQIAPQKTITVGKGGRIIANGTAGGGVTIQAEPGAGAWASMRATGGTLSFTNTTIDGGGDPLNILPSDQAALDIRGDQTMPPVEALHADHLTIKGSATGGIYLHESGGFSATSTAVTITGSVGVPIHTWANLAGTIPTGTYTGNGDDEVMIAATGGYEDITAWDVTFHDRGVPYLVGDPSSGSSPQLRVAAPTTGGPGATLTIEPNVHLRFRRGAVLLLDLPQPNQPPPSLVAAGTPSALIVFTSAEATPAAGDWLGIYFKSVSSSTQMSSVEVDYAGGSSSLGSSSCVYGPMQNNDAAIRIFAEPATAFVTNTAINNSAAYGIDRGFRSNSMPDFLPTNMFTNIGKTCRQTYPENLNGGGCPQPVPCP